MPFKGYADTEDIALLRQMFKEYCLEDTVEARDQTASEAARHIWGYSPPDCMNWKN